MLSWETVLVTPKKYQRRKWVFDGKKAAELLVGIGRLTLQLAIAAHLVGLV